MSMYYSYTDDNYFTRFEYSEWAPPDLQKLHDILHIDRTLSQLESNPTLEASFAICWQLLDWTIGIALEFGDRSVDVAEQVILNKKPNFLNTPQWARLRQALTEISRNKQEAILDRLSELVSRLKPQTSPDEYVPEFDAIVFAHLSAGYALLLEQIEKGPSERFWELIENALAVVKRPKTEGLTPWYERTEFSLTLSVSFKLLGAMLWSKLFHKYYAQADYEQALTCLHDASKFCADADDELYDCIGDCKRIDEWMAWAFGYVIGERYDENGQKLELGPAIEAPGVGYHLIDCIVPAQKAVDAFDKLIEESRLC